MTAQNCKRYCSTVTDVTPGAPYLYFGIANGQDCYCGNAIATTVEPDNTNCGIGNSGDTTQRGGSLTHQSIWGNTRRAAAGQCPSGFSCPANDGCTYTANSRTLSLECGIDRPGNDIRNEDVAAGDVNRIVQSIEECTARCGRTPLCVAAAASRLGNPNGPLYCFMKTSAGAPIFKEDTDCTYSDLCTTDPY